MAADGDGQAFAALYQRHHQALYRYCRAIVGNADDASDALQNTMAAALRALPGEQREIRIKPWLYRIAHNESVSLLRRRPAHTALDEAMDVPAPGASDPVARDRLRQLVADLRGLPDRQRAALVMRELNDLDYGEIGSALETSPAAAKQLVYEARTGLHQIAEGREMSCDDAQRSLSAGDGRRLRGRKLRAHLRTCGGCREFEQLMKVRGRDLAALAPPLPPVAAAALLQGLGLGGHGGAAGAVGGLAGGATGKAVAGSAVAKSVAAVAVVATVGAGTAGVTGRLPGTQGEKAPPREATQPDRTSAPAAGGTGAGAPERSQTQGGAAAGAHAGKAEGDPRRNGHAPAHPAARKRPGPRPVTAGKRGPHVKVTPKRARTRPSPPVGRRRGSDEVRRGLEPRPATRDRKITVPKRKPVAVPGEAVPSGP
jgi:RNA polymerase sigma factor (sigma-70 family)